MTENIVITGDLLDKLSLSQQHRDTILRCSVHAEQVATLFEIISRRPDTAFTQLVDALRETGQNQVADFIVNYRVSHDVTAGGAAGAGADEDVHQTVHGPLQVTLQDT